MNSKEWYGKIWKSNINELNGKTYYTVSNDQEKNEVTKMTKKFTEEQYQEIINIWNNGQDFDDTILSVSDYARKLNARLNYEYGGNVYDYSEAILLSLPNSRDWAHDKFVEKEHEFHFILKNMYDSDDWRYHLVRNSSDAIILFRFSEEKYDRPKFKESEIKAWGFNPEMFDKEEA